MYTESQFMGLEEVAETFEAHYEIVSWWETRGIIPIRYTEKVYPSTVLYWVKLGIIPRPHNFDGCLLFDRQAILDFVWEESGFKYMVGNFAAGSKFPE